MSTKAFTYRRMVPAYTCAHTHVNMYTHIQACHTCINIQEGEHEMVLKMLPFLADFFLGSGKYYFAL